MAEPVSLPSVGAAQKTAASTSAPKSSASNASFQALLDQLATRALELEKTSAAPIGADELAGAVDDAHASLQDAMSLSAQLIEAYRADIQRRARDGGSKP